MGLEPSFHLLRAAAIIFSSSAEAKISIILGKTQVLQFFPESVIQSVCTGVLSTKGISYQVTSSTVFNNNA